MVLNLKKILILAFAFRFFISFLVWHPDLNNHMDWGIRFWEYGPAKFFEANVWSFTWPNQPPGTIYLFAFIRKVYELVFNFFWFINLNIPVFPSGIIPFIEERLFPVLLKLPAVTAEVGIGYLIYLILRGITNQKRAVFGALIFLLNPVTWYNSSVWGQTDSIINFFAILSFYLIYKKKLELAYLSFALSLYLKASLAIFLPVLLIVSLKSKFSFPRLARSVLIVLISAGVLTIPFARNNPFSTLINIYKDKVLTQQLHVITANAFNLWSGIAGIHELPNTKMLGPLTYESWGLIGFSLFLVLSCYIIWRKHDLKSIIYALAIISFSSFMLLTNMHERYLYPLFAPLAILVIVDKRFIVTYVAISVIALLNLYNFWWVPKLTFLVNFLSFGDRLMPRILGFASFIIFILFVSKILRLLKAPRI